jgi:hypothetical protein
MVFTLYIKVTAMVQFPLGKFAQLCFHWQGTPPHADREELRDLFSNYGRVEGLACGDKDYIFVVCPWHNPACVLCFLAHQVSVPSSEQP